MNLSIHRKYITNSNELTIYKIASDNNISPKCFNDVCDEYKNNNIIFSEFIHDILTKNIDIDTYLKIQEKLKKLHTLNIIHGDISLRNIIMKDDEPYIIDYGTSMFKKDINMNSCFYEHKNKTFEEFCEIELNELHLIFTIHYSSSI